MQWVLTPSEGCWNVVQLLKWDPRVVNALWIFVWKCSSMWDIICGAIRWRCRHCGDEVVILPWRQRLSCGQIFRVRMVFKLLFCVCFLKKIRKTLLVCFLSARLIHQKYHKLPGRVTHTQSQLIAILVPKLVAMATSLSTPGLPSSRIYVPSTATRPNNSQ